MPRALPPLAVICLVALGIAMKVAARHYSDAHPVLVILALVGVVIGTVIVAFLLPKVLRLVRRRDHFANPS
jgi:nitrogen fixation/metabolism regulation signal transduction histidine kinase